MDRPAGGDDISLNPVSYVVLGFASGHTQVTPYDLKQMVADGILLAKNRP